MSQGSEGWWKEVEEIIESRSLLKHSFYQAWQKGELKLDDLRFYAGQYYQQVKHFPRYVSATHSNCEDLKARQMLLENLTEEEKGDENHPELWLRFAEGLGMSREEVRKAPAAPETEACVETFLGLAKSGAIEGMSALYAYESQIPAVSRTKIQGLRDFYGMTDPKALRFFEVHADADVWHSRQERDGILRLAADPDARAKAKAAVEQACDAVWRLLDGVCRARGIEACRTRRRRGSPGPSVVVEGP